uniref:Uncharacterized protein n=1 Tax=Panagrellus redivivus TaxID=6233 RepID=A0A7E4UWY3_PANRE
MPPAAPEGPSPPSKCSFYATIHPSATTTDPTTTHPELYQHVTPSTTSLRYDPDQINRSDSTIPLHLLDYAPRPPVSPPMASYQRDHRSRVPKFLAQNIWMSKNRGSAPLKNLANGLLKALFSSSADS